jgi:hypothetical protein
MMMIIIIIPATKIMFIIINENRKNIYVYRIELNVINEKVLLGTWHVDSLLGNDREISKYTTAVTK